MRDHRLNFVMFLAFAILAVAPIVGAVMAEPRITVLTADQFARTW